MVVGSSPAAPAIPVTWPPNEEGSTVDRIRRFIDEAWSELKKVSWPTREQTRNLTVLVFAISLAVGIYITFFDLIFSTAVRTLTGTGG